MQDTLTVESASLELEQIKSMLASMPQQINELHARAGFLSGWLVAMNGVADVNPEGQPLGEDGDSSDV